MSAGLSTSRVTARDSPQFMQTITSAILSRKREYTLMSKHFSALLAYTLPSVQD
jgi:hypothetical protein